MIGCTLKLLSEIKNLFPVDDLPSGSILSDLQVISFFEKLRIADRIFNLLELQKNLEFEFKIQKHIFYVDLCIGNNTFYEHCFDFKYCSVSIQKITDNNTFNVNDFCCFLNEGLNKFDSKIILNQQPYSFIVFDTSSDRKTNSSQFHFHLKNFEKLLSSIYCFKLCESSKKAIFEILPEYLSRNILSKLISDYYGSNSEILSHIHIFANLKELLSGSSKFLYKDYELKDYFFKIENQLLKSNDIAYKSELKKKYFFN